MFMYMYIYVYKYIRIYIGGETKKSENDKKLFDYVEGA